MAWIVETLIETVDAELAEVAGAVARRMKTSQSSIARTEGAAVTRCSENVSRRILDTSSS